LHRTLRYVDMYLLSSSSGSVVTQVTRVNSLFDPDLTGTGHQPRGFDQLCSSTGPYATYRVHNVRIAGEAVTADGLIDMAWGFSDTNSLPSAAGGSALSTCTPYAELPGWKCGVYSTYQDPVKFSAQRRMSDIHGVQESSITSEDNYAALYNASPVDTAYFYFLASAPGGGTRSVHVILSFEFDATFEDPYLLAAS
jgi:hypothetical protein